MQISGQSTDIHIFKEGEINGMPQEKVNVS